MSHTRTAIRFRIGTGVLLIIYCCAMRGIKDLPVLRGGGKRADGGMGLLAGIPVRR